MFKFSTIFHLHQETEKPVRVPADENEWPESWKVVEFKEYLRFPRIDLPKPAPLSMSLTEVLQSRNSKRNFDPNKSLSLEDLSSLLFWSGGINTNQENPQKSTRYYPSGGARYPLEIYFYFRGNDKIPKGIFHYNVLRHAIEKIPVENSGWEISMFATYPWVKDASLVLFITAIFDRTMRKYQERGYRFILLEAGALLENLYLAATALQLGCCALGSPLAKEIAELLEENPHEENLIFSMVFGHLKTTP